MRILRVHPFLRSEGFYPFAGGMARTSVRLTQELLRIGHEVAIFPFPDMIGTPTRWAVGPAQSVAVRATVVWPGWVRIGRWLSVAGRLSPPPLGLQGRLLDAMVLAALNGAARDFRPQIIHNHLARRGLPRMYESLRSEIPLVLTHHHFEPGESLESYDCIVFVSHTQLARVRAVVPLQEAKIRVVHNPVAEEFRTVTLQPDEMREGIVYSGALIPRKGVGVLLEAAAMLPALRAHPLILCGEGQLEAQHARLVREQHLNVRLLGKLSRRALSEVLASARMMVLPSRKEGWSASINEAICCGTPVVGYAPQMLELRDLLNIEAGKPFDANAESASVLAQRMVEVLHDPMLQTAQRLSLAAAAREYLSGERFVRGYERVYADLVR